jgi:superfamily I DNA and RNA helicase
VAIPRERIIDAAEYDNLGTRVQDILAGEHGNADRDALRHFLKSEFRVSTNLSVLRDQIKGATHQLADGLATWAPRISAPSGTIRIQATAGSGKTQLAVRLLEDAVAQSQSALYVCYNRTLADHMIAIAPTRAIVSSFHELCVDHYRRRYEEPDFTTPAIFPKMTDAYIADSGAFVPRFDLLVVDEAQDIDPGWMGSLLPQLKPDGRLYVMEDDDQRLYDRDAFDLSDAVTITCRDNYRSPQSICQVINAFALAEISVVSRNPYRGELPGFHVYDPDKGAIDKTAEVVAGLLARGFGIADIVVLTGHGRSKSALLNAEYIGPHKTRRFTGAFSKNSDPIWTEGELLVESVFRFKGQSAPAVVLSEVDFVDLSPSERRKLFVGLTRAQMAVEIVVSPGAEAVFAALLAG